LAMRFYLQPLMSTFFAIKDGLHDARVGAPPYLWTIIFDPSQRSALIHHGWKSVGRIFLLAIVLDVIYQFLVLGGLRPVEGLLVSITLALLPYLCLRGIVNRIVRSFQRTSAATGGPPA